MRENEAKCRAMIKVVTYLMSSMLKPVQIKGLIIEIYRLLKKSAAKIPKRSLKDIFPTIDSCEVQIQPGGSDSIVDTVIILQVAKFLSCKKIFEIGTFRGYTTYHLAINTPVDSMIYTLNLPVSNIGSAKFELTDDSLINNPLSGEYFHGKPFEKKIIQLWGDSATFDYTPYEAQMDLVFIDGSHSYDYVMSDSINALRLIAPHGVILWHDYPAYAGVWACLDRVFGQWPGKFAWIEGTSLVLWRQ